MPAKIFKLDKFLKSMFCEDESHDLILRVLLLERNFGKIFGMVRQSSPQVAVKKFDVKLEEMVEAGCHFGHRADRWNPKAAPYIFGIKDGVHIFDLDKTRVLLIEAMEELARRASQGQKILLVGTKQQAKEITQKVAQETGMPYITDRWLGGLFTNFEQMKKSLDKLAQMKRERETGEYKKFTKKEQLLIDREIARLTKLFGGIETLTELPQILVIVDTSREDTAVSEARKMGVPVVAIVDSNADPTLVEFPIPANDDSIKSVEYIVGKLGDAIKEGLKNKKVVKTEEVGSVMLEAGQ